MMLDEGMAMLDIALFFFLIAAVAVHRYGSDDSSKPLLPFPKPVEDTYRTLEYLFQVEPIEFLQTVQHFFNAHGFHIRPSAPTALKDNWWLVQKATLDPTEVILTLPDPNGELANNFSLRLQFISDLQRSRMLVHWCTIRAPDQAEAIVSYTIDELRLELMAKARTKSQNSALHNTLVKHKDIDVTPAARRPFSAEAMNGKAFWPSPQDYNEAMQNPAANFAVDTLKAGTPELTALGLPRAATGAFASVYKLNVDSCAYAVKCFLTLVHDQKERYELISNSILGDDLEYTVDFEFMQKGILAHGNWFPIVQMDWVSGEPLNFYVEQRLNNAAALDELADQFLDLMGHFRRNGVAHGDLQHGNILVTEAGIRLVDYDGMFVPGMEDMVSNELGHRNFQHPSRHPTHFGPWLDNFSASSIYLTLKALTRDSALWHCGAAGDEGLIFAQADYANPQYSPLLKTMDDHPDELVRSCSSTLRQMLELPLDEIPYLDSLRV